MLLITIAGVVVVKFYGDDLQEHVMELVNQRLDTKADVEEVSVKVFHKFPNTSILLENVTVWSSHNCNILEFEASRSRYPAHRPISQYQLSTCWA